MDWDQARIFLSVARNGQLLAAARHLHLDHATVSRRVNALEASLRVKLFERRTTGAMLTSAGEKFLHHAERMETAMLAAQSEFAGTDVAVSGTVRIGAPDGFGAFFLAAHMASLMQRHPDLLIQLAPLPRTFSLAKREADLAVTIDRPEHGRLAVRKLSDYSLSLYASRAFIAQHGTPLTPAAIAPLRVVSYIGDLLFSRQLNFFDDQALPARARFECASVAGQLEAIKAGVGIGFVHDYIGVREQELVRILPACSVMRSYWLTIHDDIKDLARVRAVADWISEAVSRASTLMVRAD